MAPPFSSSFRSCKVLSPFSRASLYIFARQRAVAVASCTARCAFLRLTPNALQTVPSLWLFMSGYSFRAKVSVSSTGARQLSPSRRSSAFSNDASKFALCAAIGQSPMNSISLGMAVSAVSLSASIMSVMPVISVIFGFRGSLGFTRMLKESTMVPSTSFTAPISITRQVLVFKPVDSKSSTMIGLSKSRLSASCTISVSSIR